MTIVRLDTLEIDGRVLEVDYGEDPPVELQWLNLDHEYRRSGDWVEKDDTIAKVQVKVEENYKKEVEGFLNNYTKQSSRIVNKEYLIESPCSGYICRTTKGGARMDMSGIIALIRKDVKFKNEYGHIEHIILSDEHRSRSEELVFERLLDNFDRITKNKCSKYKLKNYNKYMDAKYREKGYKIKIWRINGEKSKDILSEGDYVFYSWDSITEEENIQKDADYIYYLLDDGEYVNTGDAAALIFQANSFEVEDEYNRSGSGYIYVMVSSQSPKMVKIGMTERDPEKRAEELTSRTAVSMPYIVAYQAKTESPKRLERKVHNKLADSRVNPNREFFKVPVKRAISVIEEFL